MLCQLSYTANLSYARCTRSCEDWPWRALCRFRSLYPYPIFSAMMVTCTTPQTRMLSFPKPTSGIYTSYAGFLLLPPLRFARLRFGFHSIYRSRIQPRPLAKLSFSTAYNLATNFTYPRLTGCYRHITIAFVLCYSTLVTTTLRVSLSAKVLYLRLSTKPISEAYVRTTASLSKGKLSLCPTAISRISFLRSCVTSCFFIFNAYLCG